MREQRLRDGPKRERAVALNRSTGQHKRSPTNALLGRLPQQARLADPSLARYDRRRAMSVGQAIEGTSELLPLLFAADNHGAQQLSHSDEHAMNAGAHSERPGWTSGWSSPVRAATHLAVTKGDDTASSPTQPRG